MKILLVNNNTQHLTSLKKALAGHKVELQDYKPGLDFHWQGKELVILSGGGGEGLEIDDHIEPGRLWYEDQIAFVKSCPIKMLGICMGFEVIAKAYGADVPKMNHLLQKQAPVKATRKGQAVLGDKNFIQTEAHQWHVVKPPADFEILADSDYGVEIIKKGNKIASQFHPEASGTLKIANLIAAL